MTVTCNLLLHLQTCVMATRTVTGMPSVTKTACASAVKVSRATVLHAGERM